MKETAEGNISSAGMRNGGEDSAFGHLQYQIIGEELQVLSMVLMPGQTIFVNEANIICCSDGLIKLHIRKKCCGELLE